MSYKQGATSSDSRWSDDPSMTAYDPCLPETVCDSGIAFMKRHYPDLDRLIERADELEGNFQRYDVPRNDRPPGSRHSLLMRRLLGGRSASVAMPGCFHTWPRPYIATSTTRGRRSAIGGASLG
jgi:hypothetical protein